MARKIVFGITLIAVVAGVAVWSYERGLSASHAMEATRLMVFVQRQNECIETSDISCTAEVNRELAVVIAGQLRRSDISVLGKADRETVEQFIRKTESMR